MKVHELKCWPEPFEAVMAGHKTCEVRVNDRGFQPWDVLHLREWDPRIHVQNGGDYTLRGCLVEVSHIVRGGEFGLADDLVVMSIRRLNTHHRKGAE